MNATYQLIAALTGQRNVIPIPVLYIRAFGEYEAAAMLTQLTYWDERLAPERDGWQYHTEADWGEQLAFTRRDVERARKALLGAGVIEYDLKGIPAKGHYRVKKEALVKFLTELCATPDCTDRTNKDGVGVQASLLKTVQTNTETTHQPTSLFPLSSGKNEEKRETPGKKGKREAKVKAKTDLQRLEELLGEAGPFARKLVTGYGSSATTMLRRLDATPSLLVSFTALTEEAFTELLTRAKDNAKQHTDGWQSNVGAQFLNLLSSSNHGRRPAPLVDQNDTLPNPFSKEDQFSDWYRFQQNKRYVLGVRENGGDLERAAQLEQTLRDIIKQEKEKHEGEPE